MELEQVLPGEIERRSFELIGAELTVALPEQEAPIIKRVIHTTADFDYAKTLCFSPQVVPQALDALRQGAKIVTDTNMAKAGINQKKLKQWGGAVHCFIAEEEVAGMAAQKGTTRAAASMEKAASLQGPLIFAIGNAPTALIRLLELTSIGKIRPAVIIGVPVGFVNVTAAKEMLMNSDVPYIVSKGRKGGSNVAAAICNALLYLME